MNIATTTKGQAKQPKSLSLPNILTYARIAAIPVLHQSAQRLPFPVVSRWLGDRLALMVDCNQGWRMPWDTEAPWTLEHALPVVRGRPKSAGQGPGPCSSDGQASDDTKNTCGPSGSGGTYTN